MLRVPLLCSPERADTAAPLQVDGEWDIGKAVGTEKRNP
jgi:hypothetical protein